MADSTTVIFPGVMPLPPPRPLLFIFGKERRIYTPAREHRKDAARHTDSILSILICYLELELELELERRRRLFLTLQRIVTTFPPLVRRVLTLHFTTFLPLDLDIFYPPYLKSKNKKRKSLFSRISYGESLELAWTHYRNG